MKVEKEDVVFCLKTWRVGCGGKAAQRQRVQAPEVGMLRVTVRVSITMTVLMPK